jgi:hypothetical protein
LDWRFFSQQLFHSSNQTTLVPATNLKIMIVVDRKKSNLRSNSESFQIAKVWGLVKLGFHKKEQPELQKVGHP